MRNIFYLIILTTFLIACSQSKNKSVKKTPDDAVQVIDSSVYDNDTVILIDEKIRETFEELDEPDTEIQETRKAFKVKNPVPDSVRKDVEYHFKRGLVLFSINKYNDGIKEFDTVLQMEPKNSKAFTNRGKGKIELKNYESALKDMETAYSLNQRDSTTMMLLGLARYYTSDFQGALEIYNEIIGNTTSNVKAFYNRGLAYGRLKQYDKAISDFNKAIELEPEYQQAYFNRGLAKYFSGNKEAACADWQIAKEKGYSKAANVISVYCEKE